MNGGNSRKQSELWKGAALKTRFFFSVIQTGPVDIVNLLQPLTRFVGFKFFSLKYV